MSDPYNKLEKISKETLSRNITYVRNYLEFIETRIDQDSFDERDIELCFFGHLLRSCESIRDSFKRVHQIKKLKNK